MEVQTFKTLKISLKGMVAKLKAAGYVVLLLGIYADPQAG